MSHDQYVRVLWTSNDGRYRVIETEDDSSSFEDIIGDTFNPEVNTDIMPAKLARERLEFAHHVESVGVYGYSLERWNAAPDKGWEHVDSCFGFVGRYNPDSVNEDHYIVNELKGQAQ